MANELKRERWAAALAYASVFGDTAAAAKYRCTTRSLHLWRRRLGEDTALRSLYARKRGMLDSVMVAEAAVATSAEPTPTQRDRALRRGFTRAVEDEIAACALRAGLPPVQRATPRYRLPSGYYVDVALVHADGRYTFCALSSERKTLHRLLGQLLFCYESAPAECRAAGDVRLVVFADHEPSPLWERAVAHLDLKVTFVNVSDLVGARSEA